MIKSIIFDYGNVISTFNTKLFFDPIQNLSPLSEKMGKEKMKAAKLQLRYETGLISTEEFIFEINNIFQISLSHHEFINLFTNIFEPIHSTSKIIQQIKSSSNYSIGLLSNTNDLHYRFEIKKNPLFQLFDAVTVSHLVKSMKPDDKIYIDILKKLQKKPEECLFIDDKIENIESSRKIGFETILFKPETNLQKELNFKKISIN